MALANEIDWSEAEHVSIQVVHWECGLCGHEYETELHIGTKRMAECEKCCNNTLQMVVGTDGI